MIRSILVLAALLVPAAPAAADPQADLDAAREAWAARNLDDYDFTVTRTCFCPPAYTRPRDVQVRDGKPISGGRKIREYATVPRIFDVIQNAIDEQAERLEVTYGPGGLPRSVYIDYSFMIADEELGLSARRLKPQR